MEDLSFLTLDKNITQVIRDRVDDESTLVAKKK